MNWPLVTPIAAMALVVLGGLGLRPGPVARRSTAGGHRGAAMPGRRWGARSSRSRAPVADYLGAVARELRGGGTVTAAFLAVTPDYPAAAPFLPAWQRVAEGTPLADALRDATPTGGDRPSIDIAAHSLACAADVGGSAAVAIDAAAAVLRERDAVTADARAHSAQARLSGRVLTVVPLAFAAWSAATDERIRRTYTATSTGALCVAAGLALNLVGWWWMRRIVAAGGGG